MSAIVDRLSDLRARLARAASSAAPDAPAVTLVAVSKTRSAAEIRSAVEAGATDVGENYLAEALPKMEALADLDVTWHFIGAIQGNKTRAIAGQFDWVHTVDRLRIARRLADQRPAGRGPLNVCVQVNIDAEPSKAGASVDELPTLLPSISNLEGLNLRGLMIIPQPRTEPAAQRAVFARLRRLRDELATQLDLELPVLSMGMSADFEAAIAEGATHVRIGTALFGPRPAQATHDAPDRTSAAR